MAKKRVYFNEYNVLMGDTTYLPLVAGLLHANALSIQKIRDQYSFMPYIFHIDSPDKIVSKYVEPPHVAAFSVMMWNEQLNLRVAEEIKRRFPQCMIVFGGAQVPHDPADYFRRHAFIDIAIRGEGEEGFAEILLNLLDGCSFEHIPGATWRTASGEIQSSVRERPFKRELDEYPSPYLEGLFDDLIAENPGLNFQAIMETNRGCPFLCTFCYWGKGGLSRKHRYYGLDRVFREIDWMAEHKIRYIFNADSNFGMHKRDREIAEYLVKSKNRTGYPEKFRTCYGKNTDEKIIEIGAMFHNVELDKSVSISYQSTSPIVQKNMKRENIKLSVAKELHKKFNARKIPVYTEMILGLPGETALSWRQGIDYILASGLKNQLFVYLCQMYPNTELAEAAYQRKFGIVTRRLPLNEMHGSVRGQEWATEYEDIVVATDSMSISDWKEMAVFSWMTMLMHSLKAGFFLMLWLFDRHAVPHADFLVAVCGIDDGRKHHALSALVRIFRDKADAIASGEGRGCIRHEYGDTYWEVEEAAFLDLANDFVGFYEELRHFTGEFLSRRGVAYACAELDDVIEYQKLRMPPLQGAPAKIVRMSHSVASYFEAYFDDDRRRMSPVAENVAVRARVFDGDLRRYARETILWGRKSGTMLTSVDVRPAEQELSQTLTPAPAQIGLAGS